MVYELLKSVREVGMLEFASLSANEIGDCFDFWLKGEGVPQNLNPSHIFTFLD